MPCLSDERFAALRAQGFTGATSDMLLQWLQANGSTAKAVPDAWKEMLESQGHAYGHRNDSWFNFLSDLGYEGSLNDREMQFWQNGGTISSEGVRITDQPDVVKQLERSAATFTVDATSGNGSALSYQWQEYITGTGWLDLAGETSDTLVIDPLLVSDHGRTFRCVVCNSYNCVNSQSAAITITGAWWFIQDEADNRIVEETAVDDTIDERSEDTPYPG